MGAYENGVTTRRAILDACKQLFYDKGFHGTSYDDICREAHVNRGSIYYHFKEKENIRYEVLWEYTIANFNAAKRYCDDPVYQPSVGMYFTWYQVCKDPKMGRFFTEYYDDYPVYHPGNSLAVFYKVLHSHMYSELWEEEECSYLPFASGYGYIMALMDIGHHFPERTTPLELYHQCFTGTNIIRGVPADDVNKAWDIIADYINKIPAAAQEALLEPPGT